jgi:Septum formation
VTDQPMDLPPAIEPPEAFEAPPSPAPAPVEPKPSKKRPIIIIGLIGVFLAVVLFMVRDNGAVDDLKVGDCFDLPSADTIETVTHHACTEPHTAEVFHVVEFTGSDMDTPITLVIKDYVDSTCTPTFATYVGTPYVDSALDYGWFYPTVEGWQNGDRTITCYVTTADLSPMSTSAKGLAQ